jgi:alkylated DNA repair protein (DNA oxidative demethylase)
MFHPETRFGKKMSVKMTSAGQAGWVSDRRGYRYERHHPSGIPWPEIPTMVLDIWHDVTGLDRTPDSCLINYYAQNAKMGMHQDRDEANFDWPVVSLSLGDDALFRIGGTERGGATESFWLTSGDVVVLRGESRLAYHGIDRTRFGSSSLLQDGGRLNLTLRVVG